MKLSNQQYKILKLFYENEKIPIDDFPKYKIEETSSLFFGLSNGGYLKSSDHESYQEDNTFAIVGTAYRITHKGKAAYEEYLKILNNEKAEKQSLDFQKRQTEANENAVEESKKANAISEKALQKAQKANTISIIGIILSAAALITSIMAIIVEIALNI